MTEKLFLDSDKQESRLDEWFGLQIEKSLRWAWEHGAKHCDCENMICDHLRKWMKESPQRQAWNKRAKGRITRSMGSFYDELNL